MRLEDTYGMPKESHSDGDSMMWSGLMQAAGDSSSSTGIKMCQSEDGRMWRSPDRKHNQPTNSFSRDMALGFILYIQASRDYEMANKWINYIRSTGYLFPKVESSDTRHIITPAIWWAMSYAGIEVGLFYKLTRFLLKPYNLLEIMWAPKGYALHLKAVICLLLAIHSNKRDYISGKMLLRREPSNPFFMWLAGDKESALLTSNKYKSTHDISPGHCSQWAWQRTDSEEAWRDSMGWDFVFIEKLCDLDIK